MIVATSAAISLDGDTTTGETITQVKYDGELVSYDAKKSVIVREGQDKFSFQDMNKEQSLKILFISTITTT